MNLVNKIKSINTNWLIAVVFIVVTWVNFNITRWQKGNIIAYDVISYYSYLPAVFYERDLSLSFLDDSLNKEIELRYYWPNIDSNGNKLIKANMGMAFTYLPFFALAHVYCKLFNEEANGFSDPYHFAIQFSSLFYFLAGLFFLHKILKLFFNNITVIIISCLITFGTNLLYYLTNGAGMAHATDFAFIAAFIYCTIRWHQSPSLRFSIIAGCLVGLITLIRPINILVFVIFIFYNVNSYTELVIKIKLLAHGYRHILIIVFFGILIYLPQLIYCKWLTGHFFINSYIGERFYFNNPHIIDGFFSFRKGWLIYTPIMAFSLVGLYYLKNKARVFFTATLFFLLIYFYCVFSWWCWWYGGSYGQRSLIDIYPLLAVPFAAFIDRLQYWRGFRKIAISTILVLFFLLNIFQTMQAKWNTIHFDSMTKEAYLDAFFRLTKNPDREKFLKHPDYEKARQGIDEY